MRNIVCLGYAKCGTTMLDAMFRKSKRVATPYERKEIKFFLPPQYPSGDHYKNYMAQFFKEQVPDGVTHTFEASPPYCHQPIQEFKSVVERIKETLPDPHLVVCLRHPVARAYSHYIHNLHAFALRGDKVYGKRFLLPQRVYDHSFEQALERSPSILSHYFEYLNVVYEGVGPENVTLFFLESDAQNFGDWVSGLAGKQVALELDIGESGPAQVIPRRPVPNYVVKDEDLIAFGSREGEVVKYEGLSHSERRKVLDSRKRWSLEISAEEVERLTQKHFAEDLERCARLTGDSRFERYIAEKVGAQSASLTPGKLLQSLHGL